MTNLKFISLIIFIGIVSIFAGMHFSKNVSIPDSSIETITFYNSTLKDIDNNNISLSKYKDKWLLINFWATWCAPCVRELPSLNNLHNEFKNNKNFAMIAINIGQNKSVVNKFIKEKAPIDFLVLLDENIELSDWNVQAIPTTFLINDSGKIIYKIEGEKEWDSSEFTKFFKNIIK